jgi:hypothetical protein
MPGIGNNLYPPIVETWMPAFVRTNSCRVYFSLSTYNSIEDIKNVQVIVSNQNSNMSVLNKELYPAEIKITNLSVDNSIKSDSKYFITIDPKDLEDGIFELNQFYKVQIRFTGIGASALTDTKKIASWLTNNQNFFSEWSTVCLIKGIQQPKIYIKGFENNDSDLETIFTSEVVDFIGQMYFDENNEIEKEYLKSYEVKIYNNNSNVLLFSSGVIYTNEYNPNEINYTLKYKLEDGINYKAVIFYTTNNEYTNSINYTFAIIQKGIDALNATIKSEADEENGRIKINIESTTSLIFLGNITIRRSSSETNFTIWEDINTVTLKEGTALNYTWYDYTVKSGVWYKYCAQKRDSNGNRGSIINTKYPVMIVFEDIFLTRDQMQLRIKYNPNISSFKRTISESKTETIGSKYPFIRRNGNIEYKQFPISGLITAFCDEEGIFINKNNVYGEMEQYYEEYNEENQINEYNDFVYEREFRDKVMDFLYDNTVKLFRSTTEGNFLIKLMDISFTPNQTLGRMLYSFSATAYEVDECSIENYSKYGIQSVGEYSSYIEYTYDKTGQIKETIKAKQNILTLLQNKYESSALEGFINTVNYIKWLRLEFNSDPYFIKTAEDGSLEPLSANEVPNESTVYGYIVYINENPILVGSRRYYELNDEDTLINSIWFPIKTDILLDYIVEIDEAENTSISAKRLYYYTKAGQLYGTFNVNESISNQIYLKYLLDYKAYYQKLVAIDKITIEAIPGTVVYLKDSFDNDYYKHIIGETGILEFYDDETTISGLYFGGVHLNKITNLDKNEVGDTEFIEIAESINSFDEIKDPIKNGVYTKNNNRYIYYNNNWYEFTKDNDVLCPVNGIIDYIYELIKGEY